jgi:fucose permease
VTSSRIGTAPLVAWLCAVFAALGAVVASIGPLLPELTRITQAPVSQVGLLISALFGGTLVSQALSAVLMERFGTRAVIAGSLGACILGSAGLATATTLPWLLTSSGVVGIGYGFGSVGINLLASRLLASRPGFVLNLCNACYGVGAVAGPLASGALLRQGGQAQQVFLIGGGLLVALLPFTFLLPLTSNDVRAADAGAWPSRRPLVALACLMALYGGVEAGFGGWLATYLQQTLAVTPARAAVMTSQYWACYLAARCLVTFASLNVRPAPLLVWAVGGLVAGAATLAVSTAWASGTTIAIIMLGVSTGPVYPLVFAVVTTQYAGHATRAAATVATAGSIGATALPWAMGLALTAGGGRGLAASTLVLTLGMCVALYANRVSGSSAAQRRPQTP